MALETASHHILAKHFLIAIHDFRPALLDSNHMLI